MKPLFPTDQDFKVFCDATLKKLKFEALNSMQVETIEASKSNKNVQVIAPTGSGKTLAFLMSALQFLKDSRTPQLLIIAPTRELAMQIFSELKKIDASIDSQLCYGGHQFKIERNNLSQNPKIVVGTPGRIADHLRRETLDGSNIQHIIFDEFDKTLELGFESQIEEIMSFLGTVERKTLVSATEAIQVSSQLSFQHPKKVVFEKKENKSVLEIKQFVVPKEEKVECLVELTRSIEYPQNGIIFVNHREACERISEHLEDFGISCAQFHGGMKQEKRETALTLFKNGSKQFLIATDIAARGIDIQELNFVIHYQLPIKASEFTHRNGRTARMNADGQAILVRSEEENLPEYINGKLDHYEIENQFLNTPEFVSLYIDRGKKDKVNKIDIVGFCCAFDFIEKSDIGLISVSDYHSIFAIKSDLVKPFLARMKKAKIKNKAVRVKLVRV